ncbi:Crp/Fnr family transcriptional regulator [Acidisphaera sp. L21]|uniref:Crp/Fnr family transcriptional regulator n=1 Tax=Acidisphaera sp. L21 TaxID=1641851 RepID=UPI00131E3CFC|nr:helix-turn-helix domain-containing protein [Acidisphaera sp. L21]
MAGLADLSAEEMDILRENVSLAHSSAIQAELCTEGKVQMPQVLLAGWACYQRLLGDGRRQIVDFLLPGDIIGSPTRSDLPLSRTAIALTQVVTADARPLMQAIDGSGPVMPGLARALHRMAYAEDVRQRDHIVRLGRQTAYERVVHLMLEFHSRLQQIGAVHDDRFALPLTQEVLADALGLSVVHINRTLQQIRRDRLFDMRSGQVTLRQIELMRAMADWTPPIG